MAEKTGIAWCDHTFNPWIGCTKVSPGCDSCYAEALDKRHRWGGAEHWGAGVPRKRTSESNWHEPVKWNRKAIVSGERRLVFCASLADVFDNEVPDEWRDDLFKLIEVTPALTWLLLTKRIGNAMRYLPMPHFENVWIGASVVNQEEADRDIPKLLATPAAKRFVSYEPALGPVNFEWYLPPVTHGYRTPAETAYRKSTDDDWTWQAPWIDWIIVGGESSQGKALARPFDLSWATRTVKQGRAAGVPVFVKQLGSAISVRNDSGDEWPNHDRFDDAIPNDYQPQYQGERVEIRLKDRAGADPTEWPEALRVQEFPA